MTGLPRISIFIAQACTLATKSALETAVSKSQSPLSSKRSLTVMLIKDVKKQHIKKHSTFLHDHIDHMVIPCISP